MSKFENPTSPASLLNSPSGPSQNNLIGHFPIKDSAMITFGSLKRPRGRPLGSKNKPERDGINKFSPTPTTNNIILQVPPMVDIIQWVTTFAQQNGVSLAILSGSGSISEVHLNHIGSQLPPQVFIGELNLVSFSGACLISPSAGGSSTTNFFNALLAQRNGNIIGGSALRMLSFGPVMISVLTFKDPHFYKFDTVA